MIFLPRVVLLFTAIQKRYNRLPLFLFRKSNIKGGDSCQAIQAGLPNITGLFGNIYAQGVSGAFYVDANGLQAHADSMWNNSRIGFDASRANQIYGKSNTVQPPSLTLIPQIKF